MNEFTATTLERMLQYLYTMNYDDGRSNAIIARKFAEHEEEMPIIIAEVGESCILQFEMLLVLQSHLSRWRASNTSSRQMQPFDAVAFSYVLSSIN